MFVQVFQILELPAETEKLETYQAMLLTKRSLLLQSIYNSSYDTEITGNITLYKEVITIMLLCNKLILPLLSQEVSAALTEYEEVCSQATNAGVDIVNKEFTNNWDYIQSCFFALTILTTIGNYIQGVPY